MPNSPPEEPTTPEETAKEEPSSLLAETEEGEIEEESPLGAPKALPKDIERARMHSASFAGPLPPPGMLQAYDEVVPGLAERIVSIREQERDHRFQWENRALASISAGQWIAGGLVVFCVAMAAVLALQGHDWVAGVLGGVTAIGIAGRFLRQS